MSAFAPLVAEMTVLHPGKRRLITLEFIVWSECMWVLTGTGIVG